MNERVLIVDDEREIADLIEVYLRNDGYTVYKFYNGRDARRACLHAHLAAAAGANNSVACSGVVGCKELL